MEHLSLSGLMAKIGDSLTSVFPLPVWIVAEIGEMKVNYSGHCYLELIEKEDREGLKLKAKVNANIWANKFRLLKTFFESTTQVAFSEGIKVLVKVDVRFHEIYGLSLNIVDIDPAFTVGDLKLQRNLIVQRLIDEGIVDLNKELDLKVVPQRVAIISSSSAAGFQDFVNHLQSNSFGYKFNVQLFTAVMQGNEAEKSIIQALNSIYESLNEFDVVVMIRGGGAQTDLLCFDSYTVAANVAQFPIPVLSGIGHDKDESVVDIVAYQNFKTPTAVAAFLIDRAAKYEQEVMQCISDIARSAKQLLQDSFSEASELEFILLNGFKDTLKRNASLLDKLTLSVIGKAQSLLGNQKKEIDEAVYKHERVAEKIFTINKDRLSVLKQRIIYDVQTMLLKRRHELENIVTKVQAAKPEEILKRGYSLTLLDGRLLTTSKGLTGKRITTILRDGQVESEIIE